MICVDSTSFHGKPELSTCMFSFFTNFGANWEMIGKLWQTGITWYNHLKTSNRKFSGSQILATNESQQTSGIIRLSFRGFPNCLNIQKKYCQHSGPKLNLPHQVLVAWCWPTLRLAEWFANSGRWTHSHYRQNPWCPGWSARIKQCQKSNMF